MLGNKKSVVMVSIMNDARKSSHAYDNPSLDFLCETGFFHLLLQMTGLCSLLCVSCLKKFCSAVSAKHSIIIMHNSVRSAACSLPLSGVCGVATTHRTQ